MYKMYYVVSATGEDPDMWMWASKDEAHTCWGIRRGSNLYLEPRLTSSKVSVAKQMSQYPDDEFTLVAEGTEEECLNAARAYALITDATEP